MKMARTIQLLCLLIASFSCKRDNIKLSSDSKYHKYKKEGVDIRVFSNAGEIKLSSTINRFNDRDSEYISYLSNYLGSLDTIHILNDNTAKFFENSSYAEYSYSIRGRDFRFTGKDTFMGSNYGEVFTRSLNYRMGLYKPVVYYEYIVSSTGGNYVFGYTGKREFFIVNENNQLKEPFFVFVAHSATSNLALQVQNKLDINFYKSIAATDTVVIREYNIIYEK